MHRRLEAALVDGGLTAGEDDAAAVCKRAPPNRRRNSRQTAGRRQQKGLLNDTFAFPLVPTRSHSTWAWLGMGMAKWALVLVWALALALHTACSSQQGLARGRYASEAGQLEKARLRSEQQIDPHSAVCTQYTALDTRTHLRTAFTRWPSSTSSPATYT